MQLSYGRLVSSIGGKYEEKKTSKRREVTISSRGPGTLDSEDLTVVVLLVTWPVEGVRVFAEQLAQLPQPTLDLGYVGELLLQLELLVLEGEAGGAVQPLQAPLAAG